MWRTGALTINATTIKAIRSMTPPDAPEVYGPPCRATSWKTFSFSSTRRLAGFEGPESLPPRLGDPEIVQQENVGVRPGHGRQESAVLQPAEAANHLLGLRNG